MKKHTEIMTSVLALTLLTGISTHNTTYAQEELTKLESRHTSILDQFPEPIGDYTVGRTQMDFKYRASDDSEREVTAFIFYPSDSSEGKPTADYAFEEFQALRDELLLSIGSPPGEKLFDPQFKTWSYDDLALSASEEQYPVLFYSHGAGAYPQQGTLFAQDLASTGYIVVSIGHAESGMYKLTDGRVASMSQRFMEDLNAYGQEFATLITPSLPQIAMEKFELKEAIEISRTLTAAPKAVHFSKYADLQSEDVSHVADRLYEMNNGNLDSMFENRLQLDIGMGMFGHSYGGSTAAIVARDDDRFVGAVNLDGNLLGSLDSDLNKPYLQLSTVLAYNTNAFLLETNSQDTYFAIIDDVTHGDFSDSIFALGEEAVRGTRDPMEQREIVTSYTKAFFDKYVLNETTQQLESFSFDGVEWITNAQTFVDIQNDFWAYDAIEALSARGVIHGITENRFEPSAQVERADFILMLARALQLDKIQTGQSMNNSIRFLDVEPTAYYAEAIHAASNLGIVKGQGNDDFHPESEITRQDMMVLIDRALQVIGQEVGKGSHAGLEGFSDHKDIADYAYDSIATLVSNGLITGDGTSLKPQESLTRAEAAVMIYRVIYQ